jgi:hypothetical protein
MHGAKLAPCHPFSRRRFHKREAIWHPYGGSKAGRPKCDNPAILIRVDQPALAKLWTLIGATLFYFSINVWSIMQGGNLALPFSLVKEDKVSQYGASIYGVVIGGTLLLFELLITRLYADRSGERTWANRLPVAGGFVLDVKKPEARLFQRIVMLGFLIVPCAAQIAYLVKFLSGTVTLKNKWASNWHQHLMRPLADWQSVWHAADFRYDPQGERYLSYFPFVEPWAFLVFTIFLLLLSVFCLSSIFQWPLPKLVRALPARTQRGTHAAGTYPSALGALAIAIAAAALLFIILLLFGLR